MNQDERGILHLEGDVKVATEEVGFGGRNSAKRDIGSESGALRDTLALGNFLTVGANSLDGDFKVIANGLDIRKTENEIITKVGDGNASNSLNGDFTEVRASVPSVFSIVAHLLTVVKKLHVGGLLTVLDGGRHIQTDVRSTPGSANSEDGRDLRARDNAITCELDGRRLRIDSEDGLEDIVYGASAGNGLEAKRDEIHVIHGNAGNVAKEATRINGINEIGRLSSFLEGSEGLESDGSISNIGRVVDVLA